MDADRRRHLFARTFVLSALAVASCLPAARAGTRETLISGAVRRENGDPVRKARVAISETGSGLFGGVAVTRDDGTYRLAVPAGVYRVTAFPPPAGRAANRLLERTAHGVEVTADARVDLTLAEGTPLDVPVVAPDGRPLPGARIEVYDPLLEIVSSVEADAGGWARVLATNGYALLVKPPGGAGREIAQWRRFEELSIDASGVAAPVVLEQLGPRAEVAPDTFAIHRGRSPGRRLSIAVVSEGFTAADEPFFDANGNGACDDEPFLDADGDGLLGSAERYADLNGNGRRDSEPFTDANGDGVCNRGERERFLDATSDLFRVMLGMPVYRELRDRIDVTAVFVPSRQAGSSYPTLASPVVRDTAFGSMFQSTSFIFRMDTAAADAAARTRVENADLVAVVTYDLFGVGRAATGGVVMLFAAQKPEMTTVAAHEFGHAIGLVADEYFDYDGAPPYSRDEPDFPNVTRMAAVADLKWARFVRAGTSVPTPDGVAGVGAFEGGFYRRRGIARPSFNCLMRSQGTFCPVCAEAVQLRFGELAGDAPVGTPAVVTPADGEEVSGTFLVGVEVPDLAAVASARVLVDGLTQGWASTVAPFGVLVDGSQLPAGSHSIAVELALVGGGAVRTAPVAVAVRARPSSTPVVGGAVRKGGSVILRETSGLVFPGASLVIFGGDRFPLLVGPGGTVIVARGTRGSLSGLTVSKAIKRAAVDTLFVVNPDGGRTTIRLGSPSRSS